MAEILYNDQDITHLDRRAMTLLRREMQIIQDPYASLNPRLTVGEAIAEPLVAHGLASRTEAKERVMALLRVVGLAPFHYNRYPHEFSGGQRQRVGIARSLVMNPIDQSPQGCHFPTRCPLVMDRCREVEPPWHDTGDGHVVAYHLYE